MELVKTISNNKVIKIFLISLLGSILLTISAKIKIPFYPVPMTMQTFVVLLLGMVLGPKIALLTISLYLFQGIFGLPVFAGTPEKGIGFLYFTAHSISLIQNGLVKYVSLTIIRKIFELITPFSIADSSRVSILTSNQHVLFCSYFIDEYIPSANTAPSFCACDMK